MKSIHKGYDSKADMKNLTGICMSNTLSKFMEKILLLCSEIIEYVSI